MNIARLTEYRTRMRDEPDGWFGDWPATPAQREACRANLAETVDALIALGPGGTADAARDVLRGCVERYNELDDGFIATIEREDLCAILYEIGEHCGLDAGDEWVDEWREW